MYHCAREEILHNISENEVKFFFMRRFKKKKCHKPYIFEVWFLNLKHRPPILVTLNCAVCSTDSNFRNLTIIEKIVENNFYN